MALETLTKQMLKTEYHLNDAYIKRYAREMGGIGKPMIFDRELVELHLRERFWKDRLDRDEKEEQRRILAGNLERSIKLIHQRVKPAAIGRRTAA
jgi:hypothetical protein